MSNPLTDIQGISNTTQGVVDSLGRLQTGSFWSQLRPASYQGIPFAVVEGAGSFGRRNAIHEYPYRDTPWVEDLGKSARRFTVSGFLVGDDVIAQRDRLIAACESKGDAQLVHPTLGRLTVALMAFTYRERKEKGRCFEIHFSFVQQGQRLFPQALSDSVSAVKAASDKTAVESAKAFARKIAGALQTGAEAANQVAQDASAWGKQANQTVNDVASVINLAASLPGAIGRYAGSVPGFVSKNNLSKAVSATLNSVIGQASSTRKAVLLAFNSLSAASLKLDSSSSASFAASAQASVSQLAKAAPTPLDAIRMMGSMAMYTPKASIPSASFGSSMAVAHAEMGNLMRRAALTEMANAVSQYTPASSDEAMQTRDMVIGFLDVEITHAGDQSDDAVYEALRTLRSQVSKDLNQRGAQLPQLVTVQTNLPQPALVLAQRLYRDAARSDELIGEASPIHPAFMPTSFKALSQ